MPDFCLEDNFHDVLFDFSPSYVYDHDIVCLNVVCLLWSFCLSVWVSFEEEYSYVGDNVMTLKWNRFIQSVITDAMSNK